MASFMSLTAHSLRRPSHRETQNAMFDHLIGVV
jgi:hypothetical protein